jgi:hypothetical protein
LSSSTSKLVDISGEFDYLTNLKNSIRRLDRALDHYVYVMDSKGPPDEIVRGLRELKVILLESEKITLDKEEQEIIAPLQKDSSKFSSAVDTILQDDSALAFQKQILFEKWQGTYTVKALDELEKHWEEDLEKRDRLLKKAG